MCLQKENARLKQHVLDVRRAARACGCDLNATEADAAAAYPELGEALGLPAAGAVEEEGSQAPVPEHSQLHRPERHRQVPAPCRHAQTLSTVWKARGDCADYICCHNPALLVQHRWCCGVPVPLAPL